MIDRSKIPEDSLKELIELIGEEEAEAFLNRVQYNYKSIQFKILRERIDSQYGKRFYYYLIAIMALGILLVRYFWR